MMSSPYHYDKNPKFAREPSALDLSTSTSNTHGSASFYANLVVSCTGRDGCHSKMSRLLFSLSQRVSTLDKAHDNTNDKEEAKLESSSLDWSDDDRLTVRGALWTKSEPLRTYFIALLEQSPDHDETRVILTRYQTLYDNLRSDKFKICDDNADFILDQFVAMIRHHDEYLLQCLANYTCTQKSRPLWTELQENQIENEDLSDQQHILDKIDEVRASPFYQDFKRHGIELDDNEILAIYVYASHMEFADLMQKHLQIGCKWKQTFYYFVRAILKIYDVKVYRRDIATLPQHLYHPVFLSFDRAELSGRRPFLKLSTTINATSSKEAAHDFAPPDGSMFVLRECARALSTGTLCAAPIHWISPHPNENEWVILPCIFEACESTSTAKFVHNSQLIQVTRYQTCDARFFGVDIFNKLSNLRFIKRLKYNTQQQPQQEDVLSVSVSDGDEDQDYKAQCAALRREVRALRTQLGMDADAKQKDEAAATAAATAAAAAKTQKKVLAIPFKKIEDEAFLIGGDASGDGSSSMCVTICNGELNPPFISAAGIGYLQSHFESSALDIFVDTYAKCGTTVGIKMVYKILQANGVTPAGSNADKLNDPWNAVPWIEVEVSQQLLAHKSPNDFLSFVEHSRAQQTPRIWKTHAPFANFPCKTIGAHTKILHIIRNPKDVVCSYFDFFRQEPMVAYRGSFNTLFDWFCDGSVVHSSMFEFELAWFRALQQHQLTPQQLLIISYEELVREPHAVIAKVAHWLGYAQMSAAAIDQVAVGISFKKSKAEAQAKGGSDIAVIVNKGKIGRWKEVLTQQQSQRMDRIMNARLKNTGIEFIFE